MKQEPLFCVGDQVVCIDSSGIDELIEGKKYTIALVHRMPCCGEVGVSVGIYGDHKYHNCLRCNKKTPYQGSNLYRQRRFVPIDTDRALESEIFESLKGIKIVN